MLSLGSIPERLFWRIRFLPLPLFFQSPFSSLLFLSFNFACSVSRGNFSRSLSARQAPAVVRQVGGSSRSLLVVWLTFATSSLVARYSATDISRQDEATLFTDTYWYKADDM